MVVKFVNDFYLLNIVSQFETLNLRGYTIINTKRVKRKVQTKPGVDGFSSRSIKSFERSHSPEFHFFHRNIMSKR